MLTNSYVKLEQIIEQVSGTRDQIAQYAMNVSAATTTSDLTLPKLRNYTTWKDPTVVYIYTEDAAVTTNNTFIWTVAYKLSSGWFGLFCTTTNSKPGISNAVQVSITEDSLWFQYMYGNAKFYLPKSSQVFGIAIA